MAVVEPYTLGLRAATPVWRRPLSRHPSSVPRQLFYLLTLYAAIRARQGNSRRWTAVAAAACFLGVGTKEAIATAPIVVVAWDWLFLGLPAREILSQRWRLYALLFASWLPLDWILYTAPRAASVGPGLQGVTPVQYLLTQSGVLLHYLRLVFVPSPLVLDYEWPIAGSIRDVAAPLLIVAALGAATAWGLMRRRAWAMAGVCFFVILAPTSSVVPIWTEVAAEHRMYLPMVGPIALVVAAFAIAAARLRARDVISRPAGRAAAALVAIAVVAALGTITYGRAFDYSSEEAAYLDTVQKRPGNSRARNNLATIWLTQNRLEEAETALREAVRLNPNNAEALSNLGVALAVQGREAEGLPFMARAVAIDPDYADGWRNYAEALASLGRLPDAIPAYYKALAARPDDVRLLCSLAWTLATAPQDGARDGRSALDLANRAVRLTGGRDVVALAAAAAERGQFSDAVRAEQSAMALAQAAGADQALASLRERLAVYQAGQPIRQRLPR